MNQIFSLKYKGTDSSKPIIQKICYRLLLGSRFLLLANNRTLEAKDKLNMKLNTEANDEALVYGRNPDDVGHRRTDNADSKAAILS